MGVGAPRKIRANGITHPPFLGGGMEVMRGRLTLAAGKKASSSLIGSFRRRDFRARSALSSGWGEANDCRARR
jgi:hypothetical protein